MDYLVQDLGKKNISYKSLVVKDSSILRYISNELSLKILKELIEKPSCAMDVARRLKQHEQKIYYHIRNLEKVGLIELVGTEGRTGGTAKIYGASYQAISLKLIDKGVGIPHFTDVKTPDFLRPFVENGSLNAKIILGNPHPHGKYEEGAHDGAWMSDLTLFLGSFVKNLNLPCFKLDTQISEKDLDDNLILIGNPRCNTIIEQINSKLPIYFDEKNECCIVSKLSHSTYKDDSVGLIVKCDSPFNNKKKILVIGGKRSRGCKAAIIAFTQYPHEVMKGNIKENDKIAKVIIGLDKDSDNEVDFPRFVE